MLGLAHILLLWSDDVRQTGARYSQLKYFILLGTIGLWALTHNLASPLSSHLFVVTVSLLYAWKQRSLWPLSLLLCTLELGPIINAKTDAFLQLMHASALATLLLTEPQNYTVPWQGVSVHVGPSCINLLMLQAAAAIGWLATVQRTIKALSYNIALMLGVALSLNFLRILSLTLLAPIAPSENAWFIIHDGLSLGCSVLLIAFVWRLLKSSSINANMPMRSHEKSQ